MNTGTRTWTRKLGRPSTTRRCYTWRITAGTSTVAASCSSTATVSTTKRTFTSNLSGAASVGSPPGPRIFTTWSRLRTGCGTRLRSPLPVTANMPWPIRSSSSRKMKNLRDASENLKSFGVV
uniref:(northern house mosquito) hypothetical protein n=1 Tax=Culex pipiens TaxID=7175 RepID=A0A8D8BN81_CULPI